MIASRRYAFRAGGRHGFRGGRFHGRERDADQRRAGSSTSPGRAATTGTTAFVDSGSSAVDAERDAAYTGRLDPADSTEQILRDLAQLGIAEALELLRHLDHRAPEAEPREEPLRAGVLLRRPQHDARSTALAQPLDRRFDERRRRAAASRRARRPPRRG